MNVAISRHCMKSKCYKNQILTYINANQHIVDSKVFQGTLYELTVMRELHKKLNVKTMQLTGSAYDQGIDIRGKWDVSEIFSSVKDSLLMARELPKRVTVNGVSLKPLCHRFTQGNLNSSIDVLVQCKAFSNRKIAGRQVRELMGTLFQQISSPLRRNKTVIMLSSPNLLTKDAISVMNQLSGPIIYLQVEMLRAKDVPGQYDFENSGRLLNYYENKYASKLLTNCGVSEWLKMVCNNNSCLEDGITIAGGSNILQNVES